MSSKNNKKNSVSDDILDKVSGGEFASDETREYTPDSVTPPPSERFVHPANKSKRKWLRSRRSKSSGKIS